MTIGAAILGAIRKAIAPSIEQGSAESNGKVRQQTIHRAPRRQVTYHHLMFDNHEILLAEGIPTESFYPGDYILQDDDLRQEMEGLFPEMIGTVGPGWTTARPVLRGHEARMLCREGSLTL